MSVSYIKLRIKKNTCVPKSFILFIHAVYRDLDERRMTCFVLNGEYF